MENCHDGHMVTVDGYYLSEGIPIRGHAMIEDGDISYYEGPARSPDLHGMVLPGLIDTHTHCADAGVKPKPGMTLEELVAPPNGLKHRYLRETPRETLVRDMSKFGKTAERNGITRFIDFREGGAEGCRMLRDANTGAVVLGRPISPEFDAVEIEKILFLADGIALSSISDIDRRYAEKVADLTHKNGKIFAIHCSERIREDIDEVFSLEPAFLVHMCEATDSDLRKCADGNIPISVCARSNRFFGKIPPLRRMMDLGCTIAMGTDNAMLCAPDLRPEARLFREILGEGHEDWIWRCMSDGGQQLLYRACGIHANKGKGKGFAVLPMHGKEPASAWDGDDPVTLIRTELSA